MTGEHDSNEVGDGGLGEDVEVFDDTDFYQQLLRDVIDSKSGGAGQVDWMVGQRKRRSKSNVDTKASKGRKLRFGFLFLSVDIASRDYRYQVHEKIQNFMVPIPLAAGAWHEAQIDELFASLLGKGFEMGDVPAGELTAERERGFKIFG
jgi:protein AATF/BFR2